MPGPADFDVGVRIKGDASGLIGETTRATEALKTVGQTSATANRDAGTAATQGAAQIVHASRHVEAASVGMTRQLLANRGAMLELRAAGVNSFQALAAGIDPVTVAMTEGAQVFGAYAQFAEISLKTIAGYAPPLLAVAAAIGLVTGAMTEETRITARATEAEKAYQAALKTTQAYLETSAQKKRELQAERYRKAIAQEQATANAAAVAANAAAEGARVKIPKTDLTIPGTRTSLKQLKEQAAQIEAGKGPLGLTESEQRKLETLLDKIADREEAIAKYTSMARDATENSIKLQQQQIASGKTVEEQKKAELAHQEAIAKAAGEIYGETEGTFGLTDGLRKQFAEMAADAAKRNAAVDAYIGKLEDVASATQKGAQAGAVTLGTAQEIAAQEEKIKEEKDVQNALQQAQNLLVDEYGNKLRDLKPAERQRIENLVRMKDAIEAQQAAARKLADEEKAAVDRISSDLSRSLGDTLFNQLTGQATSFWETFKTLGLRAFANLAAEAITGFLRPVIAQFVSAAPGLVGVSSAGAAPTLSGAAQGVGGLIASVGSGGGALGGGILGGASAGLGVLSLINGGSLLAGSSGISNFVIDQALNLGIGGGTAATLGQAAYDFTSPLASIGGFAASTLLSALGIGNNTGGQIGSALGGLGGAFAGNALLGTALGSFAGPVGAIAGTVLGQVFGGLFGGGHPSVGPNAVADIRLAPNGRLVQQGGASDNGGNTGQVAGLAQNVVNSINQFLDTIGGTIAYTGGNSGIGYLQNSPFYQVNGSKPIKVGSFDTAQQTLALQLLRGSTLAGVPPEVAAALKNSKATDLQGLLSDVQFGLSLSNVDLNPPQLTQAEQALKAINDQFDQMSERAQSLGISLDSLDAARTKAIQGLTDGFNQQVQASIDAIQNPLKGALDQLTQSYQDQLKEAQALGANTDKVTQLYDLQKKQLQAQQTAAQQPLQDFFNRLTFGDLSGAAPAASLEGVRAQFRALAAQTTPGGVLDPTLQSQLISAGQAYVTAGTQVYASGPGAADIRAEVQNLIGGLLSANDNSPVVNAIVSADQTNATLLGQLIDEMAGLRADNASLKAQLTRLLAKAA